MRAAWLIAAKDLRTSVRNRSIFVIGFLVPLSLSLVLNLVFGDVNDPDSTLSFDVGLAVMDDGVTADGFGALVDELAGIGLLDVTSYEDADAARSAVADGDVAASWVVPVGFSDRVSAGEAAELTVIGDVDQQTAATVARSIASGYTSSLSTATLAGFVAVDAGEAEVAEVGRIAQEVASSPPLAELTSLETDADRLSSATSLMAGMAVFFTLFTAGVPLLSTLGERDSGTLSRLLVAPISPAAITAGKTVAGVTIGIASMLALMLASTFVMGADWGPPVGAALLAVAVVIAATGVMSVAGAMARTAEQAGNAQGVVAVSIGFLGGTFVPIPVAEGSLLHTASLVTPNGWFIGGLRAISGGSAADALPSVGALLLMGVVTGAVGLALARRALRR